jgi:hypothetical protein
LPSVPSPAVPYSPYYLINGKVLEKIIDHKTHISIFSAKLDKTGLLLIDSTELSYSEKLQENKRVTKLPTFHGT